ncbi:MAG: TIGR00341 family protein [Desulfuromonadales bacterium]|nr:TIGR00341 family protein [Desulfuromonadales bacterium]
MALRLIEMVVREEEGDDLRDLLKEQRLLEHRQLRLTDSEVLVRILLDAEQSEAVLDLLAQQYSGSEGHRIVILPVEATLPRAEPEPDDVSEPLPTEEKVPERVSREELYEDVKNSAECSHVYLAMTALSTVLAAIGLHHNSVAIIIGAMVIAPLLGPNMALALSTTLGDLSLLRRAGLTILAGIATIIILSMIIGVLLPVDTTLSEITLRTQVELGDVVLALAAGCAGALAFTTGVSAALIGVMVAVALLPPLVTFGLLLGGGQHELAVVALLLFVLNLICVNLAGVTTFLIQGIRPVTWWEKDRAVNATRIAIGLGVVLLAGLIGIIFLLRKG